MTIGIITINKTNSQEIEEIHEYVELLVENAQNIENENSINIFIDSLKQNLKFIIILWLLGCTIIGSSLVYLGILYKGFSIGYTISAVIIALGAKSGSIFVLSLILPQNIIFLPAIFLLAESGIKVYKRISQKNVSLKQELLRHTVIMLISMVMGIMSSLVEIYVSVKIFIFFKNFM